MPRQLRASGGITNVVPRTNYFLGGSHSYLWISGLQSFSIEGFKERPLGRLFKRDTPRVDSKLTPDVTKR